jgi:hypothetical protein
MQEGFRATGRVLQGWKKGRKTHVGRLFRLLMLAVLNRIVEMTQHNTDRVFIRHVEGEELNHVEVLDLWRRTGKGEKEDEVGMGVRNRRR